MHSAVFAYKQIFENGLRPSVYTYSNMLNAYINSGELEEAEKIFKVLCSGLGEVFPNVIVFTTMMKGYEKAGNTDNCIAMLDKMKEFQVYPDARTINTVLRACIRVGNLKAAEEIWKQLPSWDVVPSHAS